MKPNKFLVRKVEVISIMNTLLRFYQNGIEFVNIEGENNPTEDTINITEFFENDIRTEAELSKKICLDKEHLDAINKLINPEEDDSEQS